MLVSKYPEKCRLHCSCGPMERVSFLERNGLKIIRTGSVYRISVLASTSMVRPFTMEPLLYT